MTRKQAVFEALGGKAVVLWIVEEHDDILYVTDNTGVAELDAQGNTRRLLAMSRRKAFQFDVHRVEHGKPANWQELLAF